MADSRVHRTLRNSPVMTGCLIAVGVGLIALALVSLVLPLVSRPAKLERTRVEFRLEMRGDATAAPTEEQIAAVLASLRQHAEAAGHPVLDEEALDVVTYRMTLRGRADERLFAEPAASTPLEIRIIDWIHDR